MKNAIALLLMMLLPSLATAGWHVEPNVGYTLTGEWDQANSDNDLTYFNFGIKTGYQAPFGLIAGADIQYGVGTFDGLTGSNTDIDAVVGSFGLILGYQAPFGLRGFVSYIPVAISIFDDALDTRYDGSGFKLSLGYSFAMTGIEWLAINLDYVAITYDEGENDNTIGTQNLANDLDSTAVILNVSFPFDFFK